MNLSSRFLISAAIACVPLVPAGAFAQESETGTGTELTDTGALLEQRRLEEEKWQLRREQTTGFWAAMMNNRKAAATFRTEQAEREKKLLQKRVECREDVRKANRDTIEAITTGCFRATLTLDLEMLRKEKQFIETAAGVSEAYRKAALFHVGNLMDALATVIQAIDAGVYTGKEDLQEAKRNVGKSYRANRRHALALLGVDREILWLRHLMIRLDNVRKIDGIPEIVAANLSDAIACLESKETLLVGLFAAEEYQALKDGFRQVQTELGICINLAREARRLNTEIEQSEAEKPAP